MHSAILSSRGHDGEWPKEASDEAHGLNSKNYLQTAKLGKLQRAGLADLSKVELEAAIRSKLRMNYLYNLEWVETPTYQLSKFNILLEFSRAGGYPERVTVALEYRPAERVLRLITIA